MFNDYISPSPFVSYSSVLALRSGIFVYPPIMLGVVQHSVYEESSLT